MTEYEAGRKLLSRIVEVNGCWEWQGCKINGYGQIMIGGKAWVTHRLSWHLFVGDLVPGKHVCHRCDNPPCCNPEHLFIGTAKENAEDMVRKGRAASGEKYKLTDRQVAAMRSEYGAKRGQIKALAAKYKVTAQQVRRTVRGEARMDGVKEVTWNTAPVTEKRKELSGKLPGTMLTVVGPGPVKGRNGTSIVRCNCGAEKTMLNFNLKSGRIVSCGCYSARAASERVKENPPRLGTGKRRPQPVGEDK